MDYNAIPSPCYVLDLNKLKANLALLERVQQEAQIKILLALKGFAFWRCFEWVRASLWGCCASGVYEAVLAYEEFGSRESGKEICIFSPGYKESDMQQILPIATHIIFNSFSQYQRYKDTILLKNQKLHNLGLSPIKMGLRINPLYSEVRPAIYNPCTPFSRLGIPPQTFEKGIMQCGLEGISGLHFHTHCEQDAPALQETLKHVEGHFGGVIEKMEWMNFGGGQHLSKEGYNLEVLKSTIHDFRTKHPHIQDIFLEPGEAVGWQTGFLLASVIDIVHNEKDIAILDISVANHMPDCLEMPYTPQVLHLSTAGIERAEIDPQGGVMLGGASCLAGDYTGPYRFKSPLSVGDRLIFEDMLHYTIVKNNTFNGIALPALGLLEGETFKLLKSFGYADYKERN
ncbi:carboxynorspermidine decarboxylase [Helicobacter ailurogastricus]|uniref:carboxynorspermidine decarboxylase n=1 Tax=Helicobacter ailurogastricus TaxID=1578720 RepID=UPI0022CBC39C|nr:carboxynorspermidine decarboxylase [Helicobacter ailurogastricus]GLH57373.1 Carboxynorspermidine decarboxylase [Helicobacter ailurogastricus]GLH58745.1 Carboxynorspermidine decarboxylase [Helicobacter ailurogastricus]